MKKRNNIRIKNTLLPQDLNDEPRENLDKLNYSPGLKTETSIFFRGDTPFIFLPLIRYSLSTVLN